MESLVKRIGYFLRETHDSKGTSQENRYIVRYFILDNDYNLHYTVAYSTLQDVIATSQKYSDLYEKIEQKFKSIKISDIKVSKVKEYERPEFMPFLNQNYCDVTLSIQDANLETSAVGSGGTSSGRRGSSGQKKSEYNLLFFTFKDQHIHMMRDFLLNYHEEVKNDKLEELNTYVILDNTTDLNVSLLSKRGDSENHRINEKISAVKMNYLKMQDIFEKVKQEEIEAQKAREEEKKEVEEAGEVDEEKLDKDGDSKGSVDEDTHVEEGKGEEAGKEEAEEAGDDEETQEKIGNVEEENEGEEGGEEGGEEEQEEQVKQDHNTTLKKRDSILKLNSGATYSGPTKEGRAHGNGKEFFKSGISYVGTFKHGKRHGYGYFINSEKSMCYVESMDGEIVGI